MAQVSYVVDDQGRRSEAETLLLEAVPKMPPRDADTLRAIRFLDRLYADWNHEESDLVTLNRHSG